MMGYHEMKAANEFVVKAHIAKVKFYRIRVDDVNKGRSRNYGSAFRYYTSCRKFYTDQKVTLVTVMEED